MGSGANALNGEGWIYAVCTDTNGNIFAAGDFRDSAYAFAPYYIAKWDHLARHWQELGTGIDRLKANDGIITVCIDRQNNLYAAGYFTDSGSIVFPEGHQYVAKWDGLRWSKLGTGINALNAHGVINSICVDDSGNVYAAGNFRNSVGQCYVAKWNGTNWRELNGLYGNGFIYSLCVDDSFNVYAAGNFSDMMGSVYVAKYSPITQTWSELGMGVDSGTTKAFIGFKSIVVDSLHNIYAAVNFIHTPSGITFGNVFKWNGLNWRQVGSLNANSYISAVCLSDNKFLYAAGEFTDTFGKRNVAQCDNRTNEWSELTGTSPLNANSGVNAICVDRNFNVYAGGAFTDSISHSHNFCYVAEFGTPPLGIGKLSDLAGISVSPNPTKEAITIESDYLADHEELTITNAVGQSLLTQRVTSTRERIDIKSWPTGVYIYYISAAGSSVQTGKIMKY